MIKTLGFVLAFAPALALAGCADGRQIALETCKSEIEKEAPFYWGEGGAGFEELYYLGPFETPRVEVFLGTFNETGGRISGYYTVELPSIEFPGSYFQISGTYSCNSDVSEWEFEEYEAKEVW